MADLLASGISEPSYVTSFKEKYGMERLFEFDDDILEGESIDLDALLNAVSFGKGGMCVFAPKVASTHRGAMLNKPDYLYPALCILIYGYFVQNQIWSFMVWLGGGFVVFFLAQNIRDRNEDLGCQATAASRAGY